MNGGFDTYYYVTNWICLMIEYSYLVKSEIYAPRGLFNALFIRIMSFFTTRDVVCCVTAMTDGCLI